jgi:hypothetical protein
LEKSPQLGLFLAIAVLASASTWVYVDQVMKTQQVAYAALHDVPRGNLSDLYPRWLGARELLRRGRNPYSPEITREIQQGYYGRLLDPSRPNDPKDQQGFAYPVYVVFLLAPSIDLPFERVHIAFWWLLIVLAPASIWLWLRVLRWRPAFLEALVYAILMVGWLPMVQGIKLQQLSLLVAGLFAACGACLVEDWLFCAGGLLALATIKPQLAWPLVVWLLLWTASDWRSRRRFALGFGLIMLILLGGAELVLPGWLGMFVGAIGQYHLYTQNHSLLVWFFGTIIGRIFEGASVLACAACVWRVRREPATSTEFGRATALVLALTVVIVPMIAPYNQVLLVPAILALVRSSTSATPILPAVRLARIAGGILLLWPWIAALGLSAVSLWLTPELRQRLWPVPFYSNFMVPVFVFGLALVDAGIIPAHGLREGAAAE